MYTAHMPRFFPYLNHHEAVFKQYGEPVDYKKHQTIVWRKETSEWVYFLKTGVVKAAFTLSDGTERLLGYFLPGMTFAQMGSFFSDPHASLEYEATERTTLYRMPREKFLQLLQTDSILNQEYLDQILRNQIFLIERIEYQGEKGIKAKTMKWLLFMHKYYCLPEQKECTISVPLTHEVVANFLHATRESISKTLMRLRRDGFIKIEKKHITITDIKKLREYSSQL